jgi:hypothetical protein
MYRARGVQINHHYRAAAAALSEFALLAPGLMKGVAKRTH